MVPVTKKSRAAKPIASVVSAAPVWGSWPAGVGVGVATAPTQLQSELSGQTGDLQTPVKQNRPDWQLALLPQVPPQELGSSSSGGEVGAGVDVGDAALTE